MPPHYNPSIAEDAAKIFNTKAGAHISNIVADAIIPVVQIARFCNIVRDTSAVNATSATIFTTPPDKDFYLVAASLSVIKDGTSTSLDTSLVVTIDGVVQSLLSIGGLSLTADSQVTSFSFANPIKIDRNTSINVNNNTAIANIRSRGNIVGYTVEVTK